MFTDDLAECVREQQHAMLALARCAERRQRCLGESCDEELAIATIDGLELVATHQQSYILAAWTVTE